MSRTRAGDPGPAIYFLSDYGHADEFVGVVHAVLHRWAPSVPVIDLGHQVPPFDVAAGAAMLVRCAPYLGAGVLLAVVDPGVGTDRRAIAVETAGGGPRWLVGPDNGLLVPGADALGGATRATALERRVGPERSPGEPAGQTFDGRDLFAPAAAHLALGKSPSALGTDIDPASLRSTGPGQPPSAPGGGVRHATGVGGSGLDVVVTWIDRFGNIQLGVGPSALGQIGLHVGHAAQVTVLPSPTGGGAGQIGVGADDGVRSVPARRVGAFADLGPAEFGLVTDSNGHVALVLCQSSAAQRLPQVRVGDTLRIASDRRRDTGIASDRGRDTGS